MQEYKVKINLKPQIINVKASNVDEAVTTAINVIMEDNNLTNIDKLIGDISIEKEVEFDE